MTGADGQIGRALLTRLEEQGVGAVAIVRQRARVPGATTVVARLGSTQAAAAIAEAEQVVHLAGTLRPAAGNSYRAANVATAEAVAAAVRGSRVRRVLFLSYVGAREGARNEYLDSKAAAESALMASGTPVVIFRCTHIIGSPEWPGPTAAALMAPPARPVTVLGNGRNIIAPVHRDDVVRALLAALSEDGRGVYDLAGPELMTMDELVRVLNREPRVRIRHVPAWIAALRPSLPRALIEVMAGDSVGDSSRALARFRLKLTSLRSVWSRP
ncbi:MAG: NAD-dependent epimerase/dehydratase family protein [Candidatus Rokubacteria bacterium]|nr:NAD-dependent epimerase/dehydratase family protein [Candidatus Rokubacteria bacterium]